MQGLSRHLLSRDPSTVRLLISFVVLSAVVQLTACSNDGSLRSSISAAPNVSVVGRSPATSSEPPAPVDPNAVLAFAEQLVPTERADPADTASLVSSLAEFKARAKNDDFNALEAWARSNPTSPWRVAVLTNLGMLQYQAGYFSRAIESFEAAWADGRGLGRTDAKFLVDRAVGELARMHARLGHTERLDSLLSELAGRPLQGTATELVATAREALWMMRNEQDIAFLCGPTALGTVAAITQERRASSKVLEVLKSGPKGTTLADLERIADAAELGYRAAIRSKFAPLPLPVVVHWKVNHFAAIVEQVNGLYRVADSTFGRDLWISEDALDHESSGYFLIPESGISAEWRLASADEATQIFGMGGTTKSDPDPVRPEDTKNCCKTPQGPSSPIGMPAYSIHAMLVSLNVTDTPLFYDPPRGPAMHFTVTYNQREPDRSANPNYTNFGPKWTFNWLSFIEDHPNLQVPDRQVRHFVRGGGWRTYSGFDAVTGDFEPDDQTHARLVRDPTVTPPAVRYIRYLNDGSKETFEYTDGTDPRRVFMTAYTDPTGNTVTLEYETVGSSPQVRLKKIYDATGQASTLQYDGSTSRVLRITDPFGRFAEFAGGTGPMGSITDAIQATTTFAYAPGTDRMTGITSPYGNSTRTTTFEHYCADETPTAPCSLPNRWITVTDPDGEKERVEFRHSAPSIPNAEPSLAENGVPGYTTLYPAKFHSGGALHVNAFLQFRNTFYWNKEAMKQMGGSLDYTKAHLTHWVHRNDTPTGTTGGAIESEKPPNENRIWYAYPMQRHAADTWDTATWFHEPIMNGTSYSPMLVMRKGVDGGADQIWQYYYNEYGRLTRYVDAANNKLSFEYAPNGVDLLRVLRPTSSTQTFQDSFSGTALDPGWVAWAPTGYASLDPSGGQFAQVYADPVPTSTVFHGIIDGGTMLCRRIPHTPATLEVTLLNTDFGTAQFNRLFMLRASLNAASPNVQLLGPDAQGKMRLHTRNAPYHESYTAKISTLTYNPSLPVSLKFEYSGINVKASFQQGATSNLLGEDEFAGMNWVCLLDARQSPGAQKFDDFKMTTPTHTVLQSYTYNANHQPLTFTDAKGKVWTFTYNGYGQLKTVTDPLQNTTQWVYDADTTPGAPGFLQHIKNAKGEIAIQYTYDAVGRVKKVTRGKNAFEYAYDGLNRVTMITYADGTSEAFNYDKLDLESYRDRLHRLTEFTNNKLGQLTSILDPALKETIVTPCLGCFGTNGVTDPILHNTTYTRDIANRVVQETSADSAGTGKWVRKYGRTGGALWKLFDPKTDPLGATPTATFTYDPLYRVKTATYHASVSDNLTYTYDSYKPSSTELCTNGIGRLCRVVEGTGTTPPETRFAYDANGRVVEEKRIDSGTTFTTSYEYDDAGNLIKTIAPTGAEISTPRDAVGRVRGVAVKVGSTSFDVLKNVEYFADDQIRYQTYGNNLTENRSYDENGRLSVQSVDDDADGDGMSDAWETLYGLNPNSAADGSLDPDADGLTNLQEFEAGTDPHDPDSDADSVSDGNDSSPILNDSAWQIPIRSGVLQ